MAVELTKEQHAAVSLDGRNLLVSAAAGAGKTFVLSERVVSRVKSGSDIDDFLIITFTNAAAAELRARIIRELTDAAESEPGSKHLRRQLMLASQANITTIDAFCMSLVREFSYMCGINAAFRIADEAECELLKAEALEEALETLYDEAHPDFLAFAETMSSGRGDVRTETTITGIYDAMESHPFPEEWAECVLQDFEKARFEETSWGKEILRNAAAAAFRIDRMITAALIELEREPVLNEKYRPAFLSDREMNNKLIEALRSGWDSAVCALREAPAKLAQAPRNYQDIPFRERMKNARARWKDIRGELSDTFDISAEAHLDECARLLPSVRGLFRAVAQYRSIYSRLKRARTVADFNDVSHMAASLLCSQDDKGTLVRSALAETVGARYREVLVDEYQDTNTLQDTICDMLTQNRNNLFMVGDVKQSIYRFRLAEPELFLARYETYPDFDADTTRGDAENTRILLSKNFRSRPEVISAVNYIFSHIFIGSGMRLSYGDAERLRQGRTLSADEAPKGERSPEFWVIETKTDDEDSPEKAETEARFAAARIAALLDEGTTVREGDGVRPLRPGDIAILMRSINGKAAYYERALAEYAIPAHSGGRGSEKTAELLAVMALLSAVDNPYLDIPLVSVMRSPLFEFSPDELAEVRAACRDGCMMDALKAAADSGHLKSAALLNALNRWHASAAELTTDKLLWKIYTETGMLSIYGAMKNGAKRRENLLTLFEHAVRYESSGSRGLGGFSDYMERVFERDSFRSDDEEPGDCVRIMTIHKSKGLEFPVVLLCDTAKKFNLDDTRQPVLIHPKLGVGMRLLDIERAFAYPTAAYLAISARIREESLAEEARILYVALTRAKEKLIMTCALPNAEKRVASILSASGCLDETAVLSADCYAKWLIPLMALHPDGTALRKVMPELSPIDAEDSSFLISFDSDFTAPVPDAIPTIETGDAESFQSDLPDYGEEIKKRMEYRYPLHGLDTLPSKLTVTQIKSLSLEIELADAEQLTPEALPRDFTRPRLISGDTGLTPTESGTALHTAMQLIDYAKCTDLNGVIAEINRLHTETVLTGQQTEEVLAAAGKLYAFFLSEVGKRAVTAEFIKREFRFSVLENAARFYPDAPDGGRKILFQGVCDLCFGSDSGLTLLDFKSDRVRPGGEAARAADYRLQLELYSEAITRITGIPVTERVLFFLQTGTAVAV